MLAASPRSVQRGVSLIELMVGIAISLFMLAGIVIFFVNFLIENRRQNIETRVTQQIRSATEFMARDIRRAGFWQNSLNGTTLTPGANPYIGIQAPSGALDYQLSIQGEDDIVTSSEELGFKVSQQVLQNRANQPLTDPAVVLIESLVITDTSPPRASLGHFCPTACTSGTLGCPELQIRHFTIALAGRATQDASIRREIKLGVRVRADNILNNQCPKVNL